MNNYERTCDMVNAYVKEHGRKTEMGRGEFIEWVQEKYENISVEKNNLYPTDISFNLYNNGLKDFPGPCLCLMYVFENDKFRLVGNELRKFVCEVTKIGMYVNTVSLSTSRSKASTSGR